MTGQNLDELASAEADAPSLTAEQARELTDRMKSGLTQIWEIIVVAHRGRAWLALGYASWDQYVQREFGHLNLQPPREEREATVLSLRQAGLGERATAAVTGLSKGTVGNITRTAQAAGAQNWAPAQGEAPLGETAMSSGPSRTDGDDGRSYAITRPHVWQSGAAERTSAAPSDEELGEQLPGQVSIADELGEDAGDAASGSVMEMSASEAGIPLMDLDANERGHREQARRDLREFHESGSAALPMTIKLASRVGGLLSPVVGESPLTTEEQVGVVTDSARAVRVLSNLLGRTAARPDALGDDPAEAEQVISNLTDAVEDLNRALDGWRAKR